MDVSPTWKVWHLLHGYISLDMYYMLLGVLRVKRPASGIAHLSNVWVWIVITFLVNNATNFLSSYYFMSSALGRNLIPSILSLLNFVIPLFITVISLRYALYVTSAVSIQRESGNYDLFAVLPAGEFASVLNIARAYRHPLQGVIIGNVSAALLLGLVAAVTSGAPFSFNPNFVDVNNLAFTVLPIMIKGIASCVDYLQAFVAATLLALLASRRQKRGEAQIWVIGIFLALQLLLYVVVNGLATYLLGFSFYNIALYSSANLIFLSFAFYAARQSLVLIACREVINMLLWWRVKRQMEV